MSPAAYSDSATFWASATATDSTPERTVMFLAVTNTLTSTVADSMKKSTAMRISTKSTLDRFLFLISHLFYCAQRRATRTVSRTPLALVMSTVSRPFSRWGSKLCAGQMAVPDSGLKSPSSLVNHSYILPS